MADIDIGKAPPNSAVLPFYATGAGAFWILCVLLFISTDVLGQHYFNAHLLAIVHTAALGWGTMIIFGAAHQLLPVVCERDLFSPVIASLCWYTLTAGTTLIVFSFWTFTTGWPMISGGSLAALSALLYFINVLFTSRICKHYSVVRLFIVSSTAWLMFTVLVGLLMAVNLSYPFFEKNHLNILKLHAHAGLAGWFLQLITGVSSKLVPMFLLRKSTKEKLLLYAWVSENAGLLLFLTESYFGNITSVRIIIYGTLVAAGVVCWLLYLYDAFRNRVRKRIDIQMKQSFVSLLSLVVALAMVPVIINVRGYQWTVLYGTLAFMGWITGIILGKTFKTLPFIVWNTHYKSLSGKVKVPLPKHLYSELLVQWQFRIFIVALPVLAGAIVMDSAVMFRMASCLWIILSTLYFVNVMKVLLHKTKILR